MGYEVSSQSARIRAFQWQQLREEDVDQVDAKHPHSLFSGVCHPAVKHSTPSHTTDHHSDHHILNGLLVNAGSLNLFTVTGT